MKIGIRAIDLDRFVPDYRLHSEFRLPMKFHEGCFAASVNQPEGMHPESFHEPKRARYRAIGHDPHRHVNALWRKRYKIPKIVMSSLRLRESAVRFCFGSVNEIGELDRVLDKKHWHVIADDVPIAFLRIQLYRKSAHIAGEIGRAFV